MEAVSSYNIVDSRKGCSSSCQEKNIINMKRNTCFCGGARENWASVSCGAEKIQEILSRAINDQQDLWKILFLLSNPDQLRYQSSDPLPGDSVEKELDSARVVQGAGDRPWQQQEHDLAGRSCATEFTIPARIFKPLAAKLENSLDCCYLALCRFKDFTSQITALSRPSLRIVNQPVSVARRYPIQEHELHDQPLSNFVRHSYPNVSELKLHASLSALQTPGRRVPGSSSLQEEESFSETPISLQLSDQAAPGLDESEIILTSDLEPTQGQNFDHARISVSLVGADAEWPAANLQARGSGTAIADIDSKEELLMTQAQLGSKVLVGSLFSSNHLKMGHELDQFSVQNSHRNALEGRMMRRTDSFDGWSMTSTVRENPTRLTIKRDNGGETVNDEEGRKTVVVVYQRLRAGVDSNRKGIPADGHRRWKKYGNKSILNANFCRGYYKCSVKECNAKKMVQPTDEDPSVFEVTYTGTHTCSISMSTRSYYNNPLHKIKRQKTGNPDDLHDAQAGGPPAAAATAAATAQYDVLKVLDHESPNQYTTSCDQAAATAAEEITAAPAAYQELVQDQTSRGTRAASDEDQNKLNTSMKDAASIALDVYNAFSTKDSAAIEEKVAMDHECQQVTTATISASFLSSTTISAAAAATTSTTSCRSDGFTRVQHHAAAELMSNSDQAISTDSISSSVDEAAAAHDRIKLHWRKVATDHQQQQQLAAAAREEDRSADSETVDIDRFHMLQNQLHESIDQFVAKAFA